MYAVKVTYIKDVQHTWIIIKYTIILYKLLACASWFSENASADFHQTLLSVANLQWQLANKHSSSIHDEHIIFYANKQDKSKRMKTLHSPVNNVSNSFAYLDNNNFWILEEYFLNYLCYSYLNSCYGLNICIFPKFKLGCNPNPSKSWY